MIYLNDFDLESLNLFIDVDCIDGWDNKTIETDFDISPEQFLRFAEYDLSAKYDHYLVNSLSNTKRSIDSQLDSL